MRKRRAGWGSLLVLLVALCWAVPAGAAVPAAKNTTSSATSLTAKLPRARSAVTWWFEWGTTRLDNRTKARRLAAHRRAAPISARVERLRPATAYRFRLCTRAKGKRKPSCSKPQRFRTAALPAVTAPVFSLPLAPQALPGSPTPQPAPGPQPEPEPDVTPPTVSLSAPADGAAVAGAVRLEATAADDGGVAGVVFEVDGSPLGAELGAAPFTATWQSTGVADGRHELAAVARDAAGNRARAALNVRVENGGLIAPAVGQTVATPLADAAEFLYTGAGAPQTGVAAGAIRPAHTAVLRGQVRDRAGAGLAGVEITIVDHPELGRTATRATGEFSMAVNGGGPLTVALEKEGFLPVQRQVSAGWQEFAWVDDVVLVGLDPAVTAVDGDAATIQAARGSTVADADGARRATLAFSPGTSATMTLPDGSTRALDDFRVRATEYTVGETGEAAMPGGLPATSAYTYAVEYTLDEALAADATRVDFDRPVAAYTDNFLGFAVGQPVPAGYYDRELGHWVPAPSGRVIALLAESGGLATLDVDGGGDAASPAQLEALGIDDDELRLLAELYAPGKSLWRVAVTHFTPYDFNWGFGFPPGSRAPYALYPELARFLDRNCEGCGSVIGTEDQTYGEELELPGVPFSLHYQSARHEGRRDARRITVQVTGADIPPAMKSARVEVQIAGRRYAAELPAQPNQTFTVDWDGRDAFGRHLQGAQTVRSRVGYQYEPDYSATASFGVPGGALMDANPTRNEITLAREDETTIGTLDAKTANLGGWTLDEHHAYDPTARVLHYGDGTRRSVDGGSLGNREIRTVAGTGEPGFDDAVLARNARLNAPQAVLAMADGAVLVADSGNRRVRRVSRDGRIATFAGTGEAGAGGDGGPATAAQLSRPIGLAAGPRGEVYVLDEDAGRVRRIEPDGRIATVAGDGGDPCAADPCPVSGQATDWSLRDPRAIAAGLDGTLYVAERARVLRVAPDGSIAALAGTGEPGLAGDGGPATGARLAELVEGLAVTPDGAVVIADSGNSRLRRVGPDGTIVAVAGGGDRAPDAAGVPGSEAWLGFPTALSADPDGTVRFADGSGLLLALGADGSVATFAGAPIPQPSRRAAASAADDPFSHVGGLAVASDGDVWVAEPGRDRVLGIVQPLPGFTDGGIAIASEDGTEVYEFARDGRHLRTVEALTGRLAYRFVYDAAGRLSEIRDVHDDVTRIARAANGAPTAIVGPFGRSAQLETDGGGQLTGMVDAAGRRWALGYAAGGLLNSVTNPRGATWRAVYDTDGRLLREEDPDGGVQVLAPQTGAGRMTGMSDAGGGGASFGVAANGADGVSRTVTDAGGVTVSGRSHADGAEEITLADGSEVATTRAPDPRFGTQSSFVSRQVMETPAGLRLVTRTTAEALLTDGDDPFSLERLTETFTQNGRTTTSEYDAATRTETETSPAGRTAVTLYDAFGRPAESSVPGRDAIISAYDAHGRIVSARQGAREQRWSYDADGNVDRQVDGLGRETTAEYDAAGQLTQLHMPGGRTVSYEYDASGNRTALTPPGRPAHRTAYTATGLLERLQAPATDAQGPAVTRYAYGSAHELTTLTRADGSEIKLAYTTDGRLASVTGPGGVRRFGYDTAGRQTSLEGPGDQRLETRYDAGLPIAFEASGSVAGSVALAYDDDLNLVSSTIGDDVPVAFGYDDDGLLTRAGALTLERDPENGTPTGTQLGNISTTTTFDRGGRLSRLTAGAAFDQQVERDTAGRITGETIAGHEREYAYDPAGRLREVREDGALTASYSYDLNGNRTLEQRPGEADVTAEFDARDRLVRRGDETYAYTRNGDLRSRTTPAGTTTYDYNAFGDLTGVDLAGGGRVDYVVDGAGARVGRKRDGAWTQRLVWGGELGPAAELDATGAVRTRFVYGLRGHVPEYMTRDGRTYRFILDRLGSVRLVVDAETGAVAQELSYDAWGAVTRDTEPGFQPFGFGGGLYDAETGLVRLGARDYDAQTGRWTTPDPLGFGGDDANLYAYVGNDPVNAVDPLGLLGWMDVSEAAAGGLNELTFGLSNKIAGVDPMDTPGYKVGGFLGMLNPKGLLKAAGKRAFGRGERKAGEQIKRNAKKGKRGERRAGAAGPRQRVECPSGKGRYPDIYDSDAKLIGEVKNVNHLSYTAQLIDYVEFARQNDYTFRLVVRRGIWPFTKGTTFSKPLRKVIAAGKKDGSIKVVRTVM